MIPEGDSRPQDAEKFFNKYELKLSLFRNRVQLKRLSFDKNDFLSLTVSEIAVDRLDDSSRGVKWKVVELHL